MSKQHVQIRQEKTLKLDQKLMDFFERNALHFGCSVYQNELQQTPDGILYAIYYQTNLAGFIQILMVDEPDLRKCAKGVCGEVVIGVLDEFQNQDVAYHALQCAIQAWFTDAKYSDICLTAMVKKTNKDFKYIQKLNTKLGFVIDEEDIEDNNDVLFIYNGSHKDV